MVAVVEQLGGVFGESGLLVLPCVAAHLNQVTPILTQGRRYTVAKERRLPSMEKNLFQGKRFSMENKI